MKYHSHKGDWLIAPMGLAAIFIICFVGLSHAQTTSDSLSALTCMGLTQVDTFSFGVVDSGQKTVDNITVNGHQVPINPWRHRDTPQADGRPIQIHAGVLENDSSSLAIYGYDRLGAGNGWLIKYNRKITTRKDLVAVSEDIFLIITVKSWNDAIGVLKANCGQTR